MDEQGLTDSYGKRGRKITERGHRVQSRALSGLLEYSRLFHFDELPARLSKIAP